MNKHWQIHYYKTDEDVDHLDDCSDDFQHYGAALAEARDVIEDIGDRRAEIVEITTVAHVNREYKVVVSKP